MIISKDRGLDMQGKSGIEGRLNPTTYQTIVQAKTVIPPVGWRTLKRVNDLRLSKTVGLAESIALRTGHLERAEALLLEQVFVLGRPVAEVALLTGEPSRKVRHRVKRLAERVLSPAFPLVISRRSHWTPAMRAVGTAVFVRGESVRVAARAAGVKYTQALLMTRMIEAMARESMARKLRRQEAA